MIQCSAVLAEQYDRNGHSARFLTRIYYDRLDDLMDKQPRRISGLNRLLTFLFCRNNALFVVELYSRSYHPTSAGVLVDSVRH